MPVAVAARRLQHIIVLPLAALVLVALLSREVQDARTATFAEPDQAIDIRITARVNQYISLAVFGTIDGADVIGPLPVPLWRWNDFAVGTTHTVVPTRQAGRPYILQERLGKFSAEAEIFGLRPSQDLFNYLILAFLLIVYGVYSYVNLLAWDREVAGLVGDPAATMAALAPRLKAFARDWPRLYLLRLTLLGLVGYMFVPILVFGLGGLFTAFVYVAIFVPELRGAANIAIGLPAAIFGAYLVKSFWVRIPQPEAVWLDRTECPELNSLIHSIRAQLGGPAVHRIGIDFRFDAGISQVPRLGLYFWRRNYLILGLPLLTGLPADEVRAVIAHEYGHLVGQHGRLSSWIYQLNRTWNQLRVMLDQRRHWSNALLRNFLDHFQPYYAANSFIHDRDNELFADAQAARIVGTTTMGRALVRTEFEALLFEHEFWPNLFQEAQTRDTPSATPSARLRQFFARPLDSLQARSAFEAVMSRETDYLDTHPSLADRLRALGVESEIPERPVKPALSLLGDALGDIEAEFDARWQAEGERQWYAYREQIGAQKRRLKELEEIQRSGRLSEAQEIERADIVAELEGREAALTCYRKIRDRYPENTLSALYVGRDLLSRGDRTGLEQLAIAARDEECAEAACTAAIAWLEAHGEMDELPWFQERLDEFRRTLDRARAERAGVARNDTLIASGWPQEKIAALTARLAKLPDIHRAWLAEKKIKYLQSRRYSVLVVEEARKRRQLFRRTQLIDQLASHLHDFGIKHMVCLDRHNAFLMPKLKRLPSALIYDATQVSENSKPD